MTWQVEFFYATALFWIVAVIFLLWVGNRQIHRLLDRKTSWLKHTTRRFFIQMLLSTVYSLLCINFTYYFFKSGTSVPPKIEQMMVVNVYGLLFIIPVLATNFGIYFMMQWKKSQMHTNQLIEDNLRTQLDSLRMQLDPHFLFNNLNVLSSLITKDPEQAQDFLNKFADVYRYVLQYKMEELVPLSTEIAFVEAYFHLLQKRFGEGLTSEISIATSEANAYCVPPLSLQMLIENAVKHNIVSKEKPLHILVFTDEQFIAVKNTYQPADKILITPSKTGLANIRRRYQHLSDDPIEITCNEAFFQVKLPLLQMEE